MSWIPLRAVHHIGFYVTRGPGPTPLARLLLRFKYYGDRHAGHVLAGLVNSRASRILGHHDIIVPVPLSADRLSTRGWNQAAWFARAAAGRVGTPLRGDALVRSVDSPPQAQASGARRRLMHDVFSAAVPEAIMGQRVLLIDDVLTTGTTACEAARTLLTAGAKNVEVLVLLLSRQSRNPDQRNSPPLESEQAIKSF